jgi:hypothetical protein
MALTYIPLPSIGGAELNGLIEGRAAEALNIEYKKEIYGTNDAAKAEFLATFHLSRMLQLVISSLELMRLRVFPHR